MPSASESSVLIQAYLIIRSLFIVIDILLIGLFLYLIPKALSFRPKFDDPHGNHRGHEPAAEHAASERTLRKEVYSERWRSILEKGQSDSPDSLRIAIIEADLLVDHALRDLGLDGEHMADRLEKLHPASVKTLNRVWKAHRFRNDLVHTPNMTVTPEDAKLALADYEAFLKEMNML